MKTPKTCDKPNCPYFTLFVDDSSRKHIADSLISTLRKIYGNIDFTPFYSFHSEYNDAYDLFVSGFITRDEFSKFVNLFVKNNVSNPLR